MFGERSVPPMLSCGVSVIKTGSILIDTLSNISMKYCSNTHFFLCYCCIMTRHFYRYFSGLGECKLSRYLFQKICHVFFLYKNVIVQLHRNVCELLLCSIFRTTCNMILFRFELIYPFFPIH